MHVPPAILWLLYYLPTNFLRDRSDLRVRHSVKSGLHVREYHVRPALELI
jgi:hypothetical protein